MQPNLVITAPESGMIYINGHFAGECGENQPLMRPVNPTGAVYIEYHPLTPHLLPMARRIVFSGGFPLVESVEEAEDVRIVCWPGHIAELELLPAESAGAAPLVFEAGGRNYGIDARRRLILGDRILLQLPEDAEVPRWRLLASGVMLGSCAGGMYLVTIDPATGENNGFLQAKRIELEDDGRIRALMDRGDTVGHGALESWRLEPEGLRMVSSESIWVNGAPKWPATALETVCAAVEAEMAGLHSEAEGYLSPALRNRSPLKEIAERCHLCAEMKYALPDGRPCAALIRLEGGAMARAEPLYYRVSPSGGMQGAYQIEGLEVG